MDLQQNNLLTDAPALAHHLPLPNLFSASAIASPLLAMMLLLLIIPARVLGKEPYTSVRDGRSSLQCSAVVLPQISQCCWVDMFWFRLLKNIVIYNLSDCSGGGILQSLPKRSRSLSTTA